jgi:endonuclease/exonuclease/phosphatase family metal-dependent hydrolase
MLLVMRSAERVTLLAVANYAPPIFWLIPCGILIPLALLARGYSLLPLLSAVSLWWLFFAGWETSGGVRKSGGKSEVLTLMTYNRGQAQGHSLKPFLAETRPDLVALQDARGKTGYYRTHPAYGVYQEVRDEGEFVLLSQHPVLGQTRLIAPGFPAADKGEVLYGVRWEIDWNGHAIAFYSIHFPSPRRYLGHTGLRSLVPEVARLLGGATAAANAYWQWREQLSQKLARLLQNETLPWIMVGDLNTPPRGAGYACLADVGVDLHKECGSGFGFTFPGDTRNPLAGGQPWMRLDYVFADPTSWQGEWLQPEPDGLSQHRPLAAALHMRHH